jgi:hypothetical protein
VLNISDEMECSVAYNIFVSVHMVGMWKTIKSWSLAQIEATEPLMQGICSTIETVFGYL